MVDYADKVRRHEEVYFKKIRRKGAANNGGVRNLLSGTLLENFQRITEFGEQENVNESSVVGFLQSIFIKVYLINELTLIN